MRIKSPKLFYFEEPDDVGGSALDLMGPVEDVTEGSDLVPDEPQTPAAPVFDPVAYAQTLGQSITDGIAKAIPKPVEPPLSPEAAKKLLNVWEPTPEWLARYDNLETRNAAIAEQRDGMMRQADTIAQFRLREMQQSIDAQYGPVREMVQQLHAQQQEARFVSSYPQLAEPNLRPVLTAAAQSLQAEGFSPKDEASMFKAIASRVEAIVKVHNPTFKITAAPAAQIKNPGNGIPVTSPGGGGGGGLGRASADAPKSKALSVLGPVKPGRH